MEFGFLTFAFASVFAAFSSGVTGWEDVVVAMEDQPTTLVCADKTARGPVDVIWKVKFLNAHDWKLVISASETKEFSGSAWKVSTRLTDPNFQDTGIFSLLLRPTMEDRGLYSCLIKQKKREPKERVILLAVLTVTTAPAAPIPYQSTLRLIASVKPADAIAKITWEAPGGVSMKSEKTPNMGRVAKLPRVQSSDSGLYVCTVRPWGNSSNAPFSFTVNVSIADKVVSFTNITHAPLMETATQAETNFPLTCPVVQGDYVLLYWVPPDSRKKKVRVYQYDRWRDSTWVIDNNRRLKLAGPPYNAEGGSFSFLLSPGLKEGGIYSCEVFLNDVAFSQRTKLSVLKVKASQSSSKLELVCLYSELSQVQSAKWKYQDKSRQLQQSSNGPGSIFTILPVPITSETAGNYTCSIVLKNGQTIWATHGVPMPYEESVMVATPSLHPSLSALLLLVPLVAAAVGVLLWRQKHISDRGIEQSLSAHSGEAENIYEYPEDIRQASPEGSVYMDLKPRDDDVYKELERCEQCQS